MSSNLLGELVANNGTYYLQGVESDYIGNVDQVIVRGNGVVSFQLFITVDGELEDVSSEYSKDGSDTKMPTATRITPIGNNVFTRIRIKFSSDDCGLELVLA